MVKTFLLKLKLALSAPRRLGLMCWYALWVGLGVSLCILLFRASIEFLCRQLLGIDADAFEQLSLYSQTISLSVGGVALFTLYKWAGPDASQLSVAHVIDRVHNHQGDMPLRNWLLQWAGAVTSLVCGQSVGQEGPIVHLGAGVGAWVSKRQRLSPEECRTLLAAGVAAAIGACFDTPLAGVIFAFEVVLLRWQMDGVLPVMLAAIVGAFAYQLGHLPSLHVNFASLPAHYLGWAVVGAPFLGLASTFYILANRYALRLRHLPLNVRLLLATLCTIAIAAWQPAVLGLGFDSLAAVLNNQLTLSALFTLGVCKLLLSPWVVGLGVPGGLVGPNLLAGACLGGAWGALGVFMFGFTADTAQVFALLGMAAVMAATLNAPLAALVAVLELAHNSDIILPAMVMIAIACLVQQQLLGISGLFVEQLKQTGKSLPHSP
ncbi:MAG TPA: chloride channel protein [Cellvibrionaceae bacterium]